MKTHRTTLKKFISILPKKQSLELYNNIPNNFKDLNWSQKLLLAQLHHYKRVINYTIKDDGSFFLHIDTYEVKRNGKHIFIYKIKRYEHIYIINNKVLMHIQDICDIKSILKMLGKDMFYDLSLNLNRLLMIPSIFKSILIGTIYNHETLIKAYNNRIVRIPNVNWRDLRNYLNSDYYISLADIRDFTTNPSKAIHDLILSNNQSLWRDMITSAVELNQKIDLSWSVRRAEEEHLRQTRELMSREIKNKEIIPISKNPIITSSIKQLNTEADVFEEGTMMHHCLYTCYWNQIKNKQYLAFHMDSPESCTFSIRRSNNIDLLSLDQIYLSYDRPVQPETKQIAADFINSYKNEIYQQFAPIPDVVSLDAIIPF